MTTVSSGPLVLQAPAKLNLGLRLLGVREDGFHLLESILAPIELWDDLEIELLPGSHQIELEVVEAAGSGLPRQLAGVTAGPDNLAFRAAEAFCRASGFDARIRICLQKRIPASAGLGGGSSDAAAVLTGLAALAGESPDPEALTRLAAGLGADVPFFLAPQAAHVSGIGQVIAPLDRLPSVDLVVANPGISLATAEVYRAADALGSALTEPRPGSTMRAFSRLCSEEYGSEDGFEPIQGCADGPRKRDLVLRERWRELLVNDLESAARRLCPPLGRLLTALHESGAIGASMTGSGATVFGLFESSEAASDAAKWLRKSPSAGPDEAWIRVSRLSGHD